MATKAEQPLTPEQRRQLVEAPLPVIRVVGGHSWGGATCNHVRLVQSHRLYRVDEYTDD